MRTIRARDHLLGIASERGELLVAKIRLALAAVLLLIPLLTLGSFLTPRERVMGFSVTLAAVALSSVIYLLVRRDLGRPWFGMATSCLMYYERNDAGVGSARSACADVRGFGVGQARS